MKISIVIPVYNEEERLAACLQAVARQTVSPFEVIVLDNNSTDNTVAVALQFPFVTVLHEGRQGVVHARTTGFNAASGDIIGRIDADTVIDMDWVATLQTIFTDSDVVAVTGSVYYYDVIKPALSGRFDLFFRQRLARQLGNEVFLCGSNMALRRSAWRQVRAEVCAQPGLHEDFDLAVHLETHGGRVVFDKRLRVGISVRRFGISFKNCWQYMVIAPRTYAVHGRRSQWHMYSIIAIISLSYWFVWLNCNAYDPETKRLSWRQLRLTGTARVNPATFVD